MFGSKNTAVSTPPVIYCMQFRHIVDISTQLIYNICNDSMHHVLSYSQLKIARREDTAMNYLELFDLFHQCRLGAVLAARDDRILDINLQGDIFLNGKGNLKGQSLRRIADFLRPVRISFPAEPGAAFLFVAPLLPTGNMATPPSMNICCRSVCWNPACSLPKAAWSSSGTPPLSFSSSCWSMSFIR